MAWDNIWDDIFSKSDWGQYPPEEIIRFISRKTSNIHDRHSIKILEVGCGTGANIWYLAREGFSAYGIDGSENAIKKANFRLSKENLNADLKVGDIVKLPYNNDFFDIIIDCECLSANNIDDTKKIISEIYRVLKPSGLLFSKTFMDGTSRSDLFSDRGYIRLTKKEEIKDIYHKFNVKSLDYIIRSEKNQTELVKEWIIECEK